MTTDGDQLTQPFSLVAAETKASKGIAIQFQRSAPQDASGAE
jgi:hypothetical protein